MDYESWRLALIAFYKAEGPWYQKIQNLKNGDPLTTDDKHVIDGLIAAFIVQAVNEVREAA